MYLAIAIVLYFAAGNYSSSKKDQYSTVETGENLLLLQKPAAAAS
jgi:hypothetical protein